MKPQKGTNLSPWIGEKEKKCIQLIEKEKEFGNGERKKKVKKAEKRDTEKNEFCGFNDRAKQNEKKKRKQKTMIIHKVAIASSKFYFNWMKENKF